jgi:hypothetical protein
MIRYMPDHESRICQANAAAAFQSQLYLGGLMSAEVELAAGIPKSPRT